MEQVLRDTRALQDNAHQHKKWNRDQGLVLHDRAAHYAARQIAQECLVEHAKTNSDQSEQQRYAAKRQRDLIPCQ